MQQTGQFVLTFSMHTGNVTKEISKMVQARCSPSLIKKQDCIQCINCKAGLSDTVIQEKCYVYIKGNLLLLKVTYLQKAIQM